MTTPDTLFTLRLALVTTMLEARAATELGGAPDETSHGHIQAALRAQIATHATDDIPGAWLHSRLGLTPTEEDVLWLLVAAETSGAVRSLIATATGSMQLSVATLMTLVYGDVPSLQAHRELTSGRLHQLELVQRTDGGDARTPDFQRTLRAHPRVLSLCLGDRGIALDVGEVCTFAKRTVASDNLMFSEGVVARCRAAFARGDQLLLVIGGHGTGRSSLLEAVARDHGQALLVIDADRLTTDAADLRTQLRRLACESRLFNAALLLRNLEAVQPQFLELVDTELLAHVTRPCMMTTTARPTRVRWVRAVAHVQLGSLTGEQRAELWKRAIPAASVSDAEHLASTSPFAPSLIDAVGHALSSVTAGMPTAEQVIACIEGVVDERLGGLADRVVTSQTWDDVVLSEEQTQVASSIMARVRQRSAVYERWGFGAKVAKGLAVTALLSGPPGTGKTMLAGLIAKELGLPLYQVDLSKIVSKWLGETEKHLAALFDAAEAGHAVLLFDEADSLFGKRTEVKLSNDRHANLEVNFLLQRLERFTGICFLTTNHESAVDEAFRRRLAFHLRFSLPDATERIELWRRMLPSAAPVAANIDFEILGQKLAMSGGYIRNAVLSAAFAACDEGSEITTQHLWNAGIAEYEAMGKLATR